MNDEIIKIGTKIKALVDRPNSGLVKKDEVGIVTDISGSYYSVNFPSQNNYSVPKYLNKEKYEIVLTEENNTEPLYGRWYKALVDNLMSIPYLKKGDYAKSDGEDSFLEFSNGSKNVKWTCSKFRNDLWELMPEGFEPGIITNTFGLKIGNTLPKEIINKWCSQGLNYYGYTKKWESQSFFSTDRIILSFKLLDGVLGFEVSDTANIYLKAEGFKEFMDNFDKKENNKFEVGKWYKTERGSIVKLKEIDNIGLFKASEHFMWSDLKKLGYEGTFGDISKNNFILLTDLSEIQPYLPEGHPDKINTIPEYVECIVSKHTTMFTVGKIYNFPNPVDNEGEKREVTLKGSIWEFKPSTKEDYDAQENSKPKDMEKSEFKKGEYIVLTDTPFMSDSYPKNCIFKQRETDNYLVSVLDNEGSKTNGWFSIKHTGEYWRYATPEEITEYERLGKPYDVTILNKSNIKKWDIGTYVVFVKKGYYGINHSLTSCTSGIGIIGKISNYFESETITACKEISPYVFEKDLVKWFATKEEAETFAKTLTNKTTLQELPKKAKPKIAITDTPTTQPIVIKLNKKINYLIPKSI